MRIHYVFGVLVLFILLSSPLVFSMIAVDSVCHISFHRMTSAPCLCSGEGGARLVCPFVDVYGTVYDLCSVDDSLQSFSYAFGYADNCVYGRDVPFRHYFDCGGDIYNIDGTVCQQIVNDLKGRVGVSEVSYEYSVLNSSVSCGEYFYDSDGLNVYTSGWVVHRYWDGNSCLYDSFDDYCVDSNTVREYYVNNTVDYRDYYCPEYYVCSGGRCLRACRLVFVSINGSFLYDGLVNGFFALSGPMCDLVDVLQLDVNSTDGSCHIEFDASRSTGGVSGVTIYMDDVELIGSSGNYSLYGFYFNSSLFPDGCVGKSLFISAAGIWDGLPGNGTGLDFIIRGVDDDYPSVKEVGVIDR